MLSKRKQRQRRKEYLDELEKRQALSFEDVHRHAYQIGNFALKYGLTIARVEMLPIAQVEDFEEIISDI